MKRLTALLLIAGCSTAPPGPAGGDCVILVTTDGLRWQEMFGGADAGLIDRRDAALMRDFWRDDPEARREALFPFLWGVVAKQGQLWGNPAKGSVAQCTNGRNFSYPGYQELLCGFPDPRIDSNAKKPNPNVSVLEWLAKRPGFEGRVAAFGTWDVLPSILNRPRSGLPTQAAHEPVRDEPLSERQRAINDLRRDTTDPWGGNPMDSFTHHAALEHLRRHRPRVLYILYGETDEWAHEGRYGLYLRAAHRVDRFLRELWETAQSLPECRGRTSLIVTTDHGRGTEAEWRHHGADTAGAQELWIAALGPRVKALGEASNAPPVRQSQVAATVAALAGEDYAAAVPRAAKPLPVDGIASSTPTPAAAEAPSLEWRFDGSLRGPHERVEGTLAFDGHGVLGGGSWVVVAEDAAGHRELGSRGPFSVAARIAIDARQDWGGIAGALQDNGPAEQGWLLGFDRERFFFALSSSGAADDDGTMTYLRGAKYAPGRWAHVAATYDGATMILYVDGRESARSMSQWGEVLAPRRKTPFVIGAYVDADESHAIQARLKVARWAGRAWTAAEVAELARRDE
jgi:hypothetical protein